MEEITIFNSLQVKCNFVYARRSTILYFHRYITPCHNDILTFQEDQQSREYRTKGNVSSGTMKRRMAMVNRGGLSINYILSYQAITFFYTETDEDINSDDNQPISSKWRSVAKAHTQRFRVFREYNLARPMNFLKSQSVFYKDHILKNSSTSYNFVLIKILSCYIMTIKHKLKKFST